MRENPIKNSQTKRNKRILKAAIGMTNKQYTQGNYEPKEYNRILDAKIQYLKQHFGT